MGFLKFLQKGKPKSADLPPMQDMDMPPAPPKGSGFSVKDDFASMPSFSDMPPMDKQDDYSSDFSDSQDLGRPSYKDYNDELLQDKDYMPPSIPKDAGSSYANTQFPEPTSPIAPTPPRKKKSETPSYDRIYQNMEKEALSDERAVLTHKRIAKGPIYIRIDRFKAISEGLGSIRMDAKRASESVESVLVSEESNDRMFDRYKSTLVDIQKKILFIEQTIFKTSESRRR